MRRSRRFASGTLIAAVVFGACSSDHRVVTPGGSDTTAPAASTTVTAPPTHTPAAQCSGTGTGRTNTVAYATHPGAKHGANDLDLTAPVGTRCAPVFVFVHGGGYCCGDKRTDIATPRSWLLSRGWAFASVNYRLTDGPGRVRFPAFEQDVADAVAWLHAHGAAHGIDPNRIVLAGHSTGGEMVALVSTDEQYLRAAGIGYSALRCAVLLDGAALDVVEAVHHGGRGAVSFYRGLFGTSDAQATLASPAAHVTAGAGIPRMLVVVRDSGAGKWASQQSFVAALRHARVDATVLDVSAIGHGQVISTIGKADSPMTKPVATFLAGCAS